MTRRHGVTSPTGYFSASRGRAADDLDRQLEAVAAAQHVSKSALLLQGARLVLERHERRQQIEEGLSFVLANDGDLLDRLADA